MLQYSNYFDRDISWLSFNKRVLEEATDTTLPLYERIKFLAIYSSNLDEFYRIRVASLRTLLQLSKKNKGKLDFDPEEVLQHIAEEVAEQLKQFADIFYTQILPELQSNNIILHLSDNLAAEHISYIETFFRLEILPFMQPVLLLKNRVYTFLQDNILYLAVKMYSKSRGVNQANRKARYGIVKIPTGHVARFFILPRIDDKHHIMFLEDIVRHNLGVLFPGYNIEATYSVKLSRDADLQIEDEYSGDLKSKVRKSLSLRKTGEPSRFLYDADMPKDFVQLFADMFHLSKDDLVAGSRYHNFDDFFAFPNPLSPNLERERFIKLKHRKLDKSPSLLNAIRERDWLLHFPYHSYDYVTRFLDEAARTPDVEEIKLTQYRVASDSVVVNSLINAANNGKKVTVFVEVKARFDEENNLRFAEQMQNAGIKIISSIPGLKVHAKIALVLARPDKEGKQRGYVYTATGNFNEKTARMYADDGFFTSNKEFVADAVNFFNFLENQKEKYEFNHLLVGQVNLRQQLLRLIDREIEHARKKKKAFMVLKMNGLEDTEMIDKLYEAGKAGVKIDLIVRSVMCLIPNEVFSPNITVTRIVDKYLEHSRIFWFCNNGRNDVFISSADWMKRNLRRRIELATPIYHNELKRELMDMLTIQLHDNVKGRIVNEHLENLPKKTKGEAIRAQYAIYDYVKKMNS